MRNPRFIETQREHNTPKTIFERRGEVRIVEEEK